MRTASKEELALIARAEAARKKWAEALQEANTQRDVLRDIAEKLGFDRHNGDRLNTLESQCHYCGKTFVYVSCSYSIVDLCPACYEKRNPGKKSEMLTIAEFISAKKFKEATGREPENDDLERVNCEKAGKVGHWGCGWCEKHSGPRFECTCRN